MNNKTRLLSILTTTTLGVCLASTGCASENDIADGPNAVDTDADLPDDDGSGDGDSDEPAGDPDGSSSGDGPEPENPPGDDPDPQPEPEPEPEPQPEPEAECGDGIVNGDELCDDGTNAGAGEGECTPDCSTIVERKQIILSEAGSNGRFGDGTLSPVSYADAFCPTGFLAMFVYGDERVATVEPYDGDGQIDWVLSPDTEYVNVDGDRIWTTSDIALLGVDIDGEFVGLDNPISEFGYQAWTGMRPDYTGHDATCTEWTFDDPTGILTEGSTGRADVMDADAIGPATDYGRGYCAIEHRFFCVEQ